MTELTKIIKNCLENIHEISLSKFNYEYGNNYIRINGNYNRGYHFKFFCGVENSILYIMNFAVTQKNHGTIYNYNMYMSFKQDLCELDALNNITEYLRGKLCSRRDNYIISTNSS